MPFGLRNASQTFQRHIDSVLRDVPNACAYIDDILVASSSHEQHLADLRQVLEALSKHNLRISVSKSTFAKDSVDFLGCSVSADGIKPLKSRTINITTFPSPTVFAELRRFLGMVGFYRRFVPNFANIVHPMQQLVTIHTKDPKSFKWTADAEAAFTAAKEALANCVTLNPVSTSPKFQLVTDASSVAVGAALHQLCGDAVKPVAFFSRKLTAQQRVYSAYDRELLAMYLSVLHFKPIIEGQQLIVVTDHKPLTTAFRSLVPAKSDRQQRQLSFLTEHVSQVLHTKGSDNVVADTLSRAINSVEVDAIDIAAVAIQQDCDAEVDKYKDRLKPYSVSSGTVWCDTSTPFPRPFLPELLRRPVFNSLHNLSHPGIKSSSKLIASRFMWPEMSKDIKQWCRECDSCQRAKINRHTKTKLEAFNLPATNRFEVVHMDIVGLLPPATTLSGQCSEARYMVTFIDRATRWIEAQPVSNIEAKTVADAFL